jgi:hypothetical protein
MEFKTFLLKTGIPSTHTQYSYPVLIPSTHTQYSYPVLIPSTHLNYLHYSCNVVILEMPDNLHRVLIIGPTCQA